MAYTEKHEVHEANWLERMGSSFKGILVGLGLFILAFPLLFWNEGRAVATAKRLTEGAGNVVSVPFDKVDSANEGKLVHVCGKADTAEILEDTQFGVSVKAIRLRRQVEIYQWVEEKEVRRYKDKEGKTQEETTWKTPVLKWCSAPVDSDAFHGSNRSDAHVNPKQMAYGDMELIAKDVSLGAFRLPEANVKRIGGEKAFVFPQDYQVPETLRGAKMVNGTVYVPVDVPVVTTTAKPAATDSCSPLLNAARQTGSSNSVANAVAATFRDVAAKPQAGDLRVTFKVVEPHDISLIEKQTGDTFMPWAASDGEPISLQRDGRAEAATMFKAAQDSNKTMTWILRLVGFFVMFIGLKMILGPLTTLVDVIPILNGLVGAAAGLVAFLIAAVCSLITIAIAWFFYRPVLSIVLLAVAGAVVFWVMTIKKKRMGATA